MSAWPETGNPPWTFSRHGSAAWDPARKLTFLSTGDGAVFVFHQDSADNYSLAQKITNASGATTIGYDQNTGHVFVPTSQEGAMSPQVFASK